MLCSLYFRSMFSQTSLSLLYHTLHHITSWARLGKDQKPPDKQKHAGAELGDAALNGDRKKAARERAGVVGKSRGLQGEKRSITNFSTELHLHSFPIKLGWRARA